jgi:Family of unknown function (DUF5681)
MDDKVGYGRPPKHTRWKKGQSGNPSGRPKGAANPVDEFMAELAEMIQVTEGGKPKRITKLRALIKRLTAGAITGDVRSSSLVLSWCARFIAGKAEGDDEALTATQQQVVDEYLEEQVELRLAQRKKEED